jgi:uncharacterized protein (DUF4415 family)
MSHSPFTIPKAADLMPDYPIFYRSVIIFNKGAWNKSMTCVTCPSIKGRTVGVKPMSDDTKSGSSEAAALPKKSKQQVSVTLPLDADVLNWFKKQGDERRHINRTLRSYMENQTKQQIKLRNIKKVKQLLVGKTVKKSELL